MDKIKVCHVVSALKSGGAETMIYNYSKYLPSGDYDFYILHQYEPLEKNVKEFKELGFTIQQITAKCKSPIANYRETKTFFINNNIDIVHCHMTLANFIPLIAAKKAGVSVRICHSHESNKEASNFVKQWIFFLLRRMCLKYATVFAACGKKAGDFLYGLQQYAILNNALDLNKFKYDEKSRTSLRNKYKIDDNMLVVGHIGRFITVKNHEFIIDMFTELLQHHVNYMLFLIGASELEAEIKQKVKSNGIADKVIFTGVVENPYDFYNLFDIFILPSIREGLPIVSLEAQASGLKCFLSANIDKESVVVKDNCKMLELDMKLWIEEIASVNPNYTRSDVSTCFREKELDIVKEAMKLDQLYKENLYE